MGAFTSRGVTYELLWLYFVYACPLQHTDMTFRPCPPLGSILHGIVIPSEPNEQGNQAGDTEFFSMSAAYEALDDALKARYMRLKL